MQDNNNKKDEYKEFLTLEEVADYLGVKISTVYTYLKDEKNPLPSFQLNAKTIRVKKLELDEWLENYRKEND